MSPKMHSNNLYISFGYDETTYATEGYKLHCHNNYELYFFLDGDVDYLVEGRRYQPAPDSMLILAPGVFHGVKINNTRPYRRFTVHFDAEILSPEHRELLLSPFTMSHKDNCQQIYFENVERFELRAFMNAMIQYKKLEQKQQEQLIPIALEALLSRVVFLCETEGCVFSTAHSDTVSEMIRYLNQNLGEKITLDDLSQRFFISKHHLNKVFRKATGTTVLDYMIRKRVRLAQSLICSGESVQDAAEKAGFGDYSAFYRSYTRILGHAPADDKRK